MSPESCVAERRMLRFVDRHAVPTPFDESRPENMYVT